MLADRRARDRRSAEVVTAPLRLRPIGDSALDADRGDARRVPRRADGALADRRPRPGVLRPPGHRRRPSSPRSSRSSSTRPGGRAGRAARPAGLGLAIAVAAWLEALMLARAPAAARRRASALGHVAVVMLEPLVADRRSAPRSRARVRGARARRARTRASGSCSSGSAIVTASAAALSSSRLGSRCGSPELRHYRRAHGRPPPPTAPRVTARAPGRPRRDRRRRLARHGDLGRVRRGERPGSYSSSRLGAVKAVNGWSARRLLDAAPGGAIGAQVLVRRPRPLPWAFAYAPRGPVARVGAALVARFTDPPGRPARGRAGSHLRIDPEIERGRPPTRTARSGGAEAAGWRAAPPIQPASTRMIDLAPTRRRCGATCARSGAST